MIPACPYLASSPDFTGCHTAIEPIHPVVSLLSFCFSSHVLPTLEPTILEIYSAHSIHPLGFVVFLSVDLMKVPSSA